MLWGKFTQLVCHAQESPDTCGSKTSRHTPPSSPTIPLTPRPVRLRPGKELYTADTLSRAPLPNKTSLDSLDLQELAELCLMAAITHLLASNQRLDVYRKAQSEDRQCTLALQNCQEGWPNERDVDPSVCAYWDIQGELTVGDRLLLRGHCIVVPKALQKKTLEKLHCGYQGIVWCRLRAKSSVWCGPACTSS